MPTKFKTPQQRLRRLQRARAGLFAVAVIFCALLALAEPTQEARPHRALKMRKVQQQSSAHASAHAATPLQSSRKTGKRPLARSEGSKTQPGKSGSKAHRAAPARRPHAAPPARRRADDDNPDPATMHRAHGRPAAPAAPTQRISRAEAQRRAAALQSAQLAARIEAGVLRSHQAEEQALAQRAEQAQTQRAAPATHSAWSPVEAAAQPPAPIVRSAPSARGPAAPRRVDGFGAEGAVLAAPAPRAPAASPVPLPGDDPELEALAHPSRSELTEEAVEPELLPRMDSATGHLLMPAPLRGSREVLLHQNVMADDEGLSRIRTDAELNRLRALRLLVDFPVSASLHLNPELPANRRCARPWTVRFATDMAQAFYARFHEPLQVNSAVRTVAYQLRLQRVNGNAAAAEGEAASPHLTGQAIDFGKRGMSAQQLAWMRATLQPLMASGKIDVEEEFLQACFHISVYRSYLPPPHKRTVPRTEVAQLHRAE